MKFFSKDHMKSFDNILKILKLIFRTNRKYIYYLVSINVLLAVIPFISLINNQFLMNNIQQRKPFSYRYVIMIIILITIGFLYDILNSLLTYYTTTYNQVLSYNFNSYILKLTDKLSFKDYENSTIYDLINRAEMDAGTRPFKIIMTLIDLLKQVIKFISSIIIIFIWSKLAVVIVLFLPMISSLYFIKVSKQNFIVHFNRTKYERKTWYIARLLTRDTSINEIKLFNLFDELYGKFINLRFKFVIEDKKLAKQRGIYNFIFQGVTTIATNSLVVISIVEAVFGFLLIGTMSTLISTIGNLDGIIRNIINSIFSLYEDGLYASNIIEYIDYATSKNIEENMLTNIDGIEEVTFKNLSYKYNKEKMVIKEINLTIEKGEKIAIVGENGSGKSTFVKILLGLYSDYDGDIYINGINRRKINNYSFQKHVSAVFQNFTKYQFSINENITFGDIEKQIDNDLIKDASVKSGANDFINKLPNKFNQQVGNWFEEGVDLSGGQWQKLAIARAFYRNADIYVFDEPTAALDSISEYNLFKNIYKLTDNKTFIFITHRFNNAKLADKILVFDKGKVIGYGTHENLLNNNIHYRKMYEAQNN